MKPQPVCVFLARRKLQVPNVVEVRRFQVTDHFCLAASRDGETVGGIGREGVQVEDESENPIRNARNCRGYKFGTFLYCISTKVQVQFLS